MRYSIYYSAEGDDYLVLNHRYSYVTNHKNESFDDILANYEKYKHLKPTHDEGFWYRACTSAGYETITEWLDGNYPDAVHIVDFNSITKLKEQYIELFI